jgi:hypothetical protein
LFCLVFILHNFSITFCKCQLHYFSNFHKNFDKETKLCASKTATSVTEELNPTNGLKQNLWIVIYSSSSSSSIDSSGGDGGGSSSSSSSSSSMIHHGTNWLVLPISVMKQSCDWSVWQYLFLLSWPPFLPPLPAHYCVNVHQTWSRVINWLCGGDRWWQQDYIYIYNGCERKISF